MMNGAKWSNMILKSSYKKKIIKDKSYKRQKSITEDFLINKWLKRIRFVLKSAKQNVVTSNKWKKTWTSLTKSNVRNLKSAKKNYRSRKNKEIYNLIDWKRENEKNVKWNANKTLNTTNVWNERLSWKNKKSWRKEKWQKKISSKFRKKMKLTKKLFSKNKNLKNRRKSACNKSISRCWNHKKNNVKDKSKNVKIRSRVVWKLWKPVWCKLVVIWSREKMIRLSVKWFNMRKQNRKKIKRNKQINSNWNKKLRNKEMSKWNLWNNRRSKSDNKTFSWLLIGIRNIKMSLNNKDSKILKTNN